MWGRWTTYTHSDILLVSLLFFLNQFLGRKSYHPLRIYHNLRMRCIENLNTAWSLCWNVNLCVIYIFCRISILKGFTWNDITFTLSSIPYFFYKHTHTHTRVGNVIVILCFWMMLSTRMSSFKLIGEKKKLKSLACKNTFSTL
jgi:hypothetical protein